jgi:Iron-containing redox enzyme
MIRAKIDLFGRRLGHASHAFWTSPDFPSLYREHLFLSHSIVRASVPLMRAAEEACGYPQHVGDPALEGFAGYLRQHIPEETGHDEWILDDGEAMGIERAAILNRQPKESAAELAGVQYYWIYHYNPIALAGYIAVMEGGPPTTEFLEDAARRNNIPLKCFNNLLYHARIDPQHRQDLNDVLDSLPLTPDHLGLIGLSALRTLRTLTEIMEALLKPI